MCTDPLLTFTACLVNKNQIDMFPLPESIITNEKAGEFSLADKFEDDATNVNHGKMVSIANNANEIMLLLHQFSPNDTDNALEVLRSSSMAISLLKDQLASLQPISSTLTNSEPLFDTLTRELLNAENHLKSIETFVSELYTQREPKDASTGVRQRILGKQHGGYSWELSHQSSISKADYYLRAQSHHLQRGNTIGQRFESQQGYHPARQSRRDAGGQLHRRLNRNNGQCVAPAGDTGSYGATLKQEQCLRLAGCAKNYNLYDLFVFFFGDDIDGDTGKVDEKISLSYDLFDIPAKVRRTALHHMMCLPLMQQRCSHSNSVLLVCASV